MLLFKSFGVWAWFEFKLLCSSPACSILVHYWSMRALWSRLFTLKSCQRSQLRNFPDCLKSCNEVNFFKLLHVTHLFNILWHDEVPLLLKLRTRTTPSFIVFQSKVSQLSCQISDSFSRRIHPASPVKSSFIKLYESVWSREAVKWLRLSASSSSHKCLCLGLCL